MKDQADTTPFPVHPFFRCLSERHLTTLRVGAQPFKVEPGTFLAKEGQTADAFYMIQSGHVELLVPRRDRSDVPIQTVGPGEVIGWSWLVPPHRWAFDCRANDAVQGVEFEACWLRDQCERDHELGYQLLRQLLVVLANRLAATRLQLLDIYQ